MKSHKDAAAGGDNLGGARLVGGLLRERRESRGLTTEQVGLALRRAPHQIVAVEEGRFDDLPPQPYARGLVGAYAALVGLEPEQMLRICWQSLSGGQAAPQSRIFRYPDRERFVWREWTIPLTLAAIAAALAIARATLVPEPVQIDVPVSRSVAQVRPAQQAAIPAEPPAPSAVPAVPEAEPGVRVLMRCEGATWVDAASDGGELRRHDLGPGQNLELTARERLSLAIGDAGVIRLTVNGRELGFIGNKGEKKTGLSFAAPKASPAQASGAADVD